MRGETVLGAKLEAYTLQDEGRDTIEANEDLGHPVDAARLRSGCGYLARPRCLQVRLLTNSRRSLRSSGGTGHLGRRAHPGRDGAERGGRQVLLLTKQKRGAFGGSA